MLAHSSERKNSDSEGDASKVGIQKLEFILTSANTKRDLLHERKRFGDLNGDGEEFYGSFQSRHRSQSFLMDNLLDFGKVQKQEIAERAVRRVKEGTSAVFVAI